MYKNEILVEMYNFAKEKGLCTNKKSFAKLIGISESNYSKVFADTNERFCTTNVLLKANAALNNVFSSEWLMNGTGDMYAQNNSIGTHTHAHEEEPTDLTIRIQELEYLVELQRHRIAQLERENEELKKTNTIASNNVTTA